MASSVAMKLCVKESVFASELCNLRAVEVAHGFDAIRVKFLNIIAFQYAIRCDVFFIEYYVVKLVSSLNFNIVV